MNRLGLAIVVTLICVLSAAPAGAQANLGAAPGCCDKACLRAMTDAYFRSIPVRRWDRVICGWTGTESFLDRFL